MRRFLIFLAVFLVVASAATGVHASTDCERWFIAYKNSLAQTAAAKHLVAAKHRVHRYVHRKLAALQKPKPANKPRVLPARFPRPKMTREEALRRFNLACGDLPEDMPTLQTVNEEEPRPDYLALPMHSDMSPDKPTDEGMIAKNVVPPSEGGGDGGWGPGGFYPSGPGGFGGFGGGGTPPGTTNPHSPGTPTGGNPPPDAPPAPPVGPPNPPVGPPAPPPVTPPDPPVLPPDPPPVSTVPEPGSVVLVLTGIAGAAGMARRRFVR